MIDEKKLKPCPFCGSEIRVICTDDEGNLHDEDYERNPWSGLGYVLYHDITDVVDENCPIAKHECEGMMGIWIYDTKEEAIEAWNNRTELSLENKTSDKWIPCSEGLPELNKKVLVTYEKLNRGTLLVGYDKRIITRGGEIWKGKGNRVLAWLDREFPEPYKGELK